MPSACVPDLVLVDVDPALAAAEPDPEIQELVRASGGLNAGLDFLPGALPYTPAAPVGVTPELAAEVVWLDALTTNVDRTARNPNLLVWHGNLWLIGLCDDPEALLARLFARLVG